MLEALWSVEFVSNQQVFGSGVVVFETGRVFGGDNQYYYVGNYKVQNNIVTGEVEVVHYSGQGYSVFGHSEHFKLKLSGTPSQQQFVMLGSWVDDPKQQITLHLTRRAELP